MGAVREVVLDRDGLPEVKASRTAEGNLIFRVHKIHPGGMSVYEPINDAVLAALRTEVVADDEDAPEPEDWGLRMQAVQLAYARQIEEGDEKRLNRLEELEAQHEALGTVAEEERAARQDAEQRLAAAERELRHLREQETASAEAQKQPRGRAKQTPAAA